MLPGSTSQRRARPLWLACLLCLGGGSGLVQAQHEPAAASVYEDIVRRGTDVVASDSTILLDATGAGDSLAVLHRYEPVHRLRQKDGWTRVRTRFGRVGYLRTSDLSNTWLYVSKNEHMLFLFHQDRLIAKYPIDLAVNYKGDKVRRGGFENPEDWKTPEGLFFVSWKRSSSMFYKALVLSYPGPAHASRGLSRGLISRRNFSDIVKANQTLRNPPMNTLLGGWIEIHGHGVNGRANWTLGCVALENADIDALWPYVSEGTPVYVGSYTRDRRPQRPAVIVHRPPGGSRSAPALLPATPPASGASND